MRSTLLSNSTVSSRSGNDCFVFHKFPFPSTFLLSTLPMFRRPSWRCTFVWSYLSVASKCDLIFAERSTITKVIVQILIWSSSHRTKNRVFPVAKLILIYSKSVQSCSKKAKMETCQRKCRNGENIPKHFVYKDTGYFQKYFNWVSRSKSVENIRFCQDNVCSTTKFKL